jgi:hypothetical protein
MKTPVFYNVFFSKKQPPPKLSCLVGGVEGGREVGECYGGKEVGRVNESETKGGRERE